MKNIDIKLDQVNYTDFVGAVNQWNVLPGSYNTLSKWRVFSNLGKDSRILEIACTTGFSSRELANMSGCQGLGIDISKSSVEAARRNKDLYAPNIKIDYTTGDACNFSNEKPFTHIVLGSALGFFEKPRDMIDHIPNLLEENGYILASPFYVTKKIPVDMVERARKVFGITVTQESYKEIMSLYSDFEVMFEERNIPIPETKEELEHYCRSTLKKLKEEGVNLTEDQYQIAFNRLMEIKLMSNELREYQGYSVLVLRYRRSTYKKRCVELF